MMNVQGSRALKWLSCAAALLLTACAAPTRTEVSIEPGTHAIQATRDAVVLFPMGVGQGDGATRTDAQPKHEQQGSGDAGFMRCLKREVERNVSGQVRLVDAATFQEALFPWFEPEHAPSSLQALDALLARAEVRKRIAALGVRYLVNIAGSAESNGFPGMICGGGYGGAGCLGVGWENRTQRVNAVIWDLVQGSQSGALSTSTSGRSVFIGYVIPIMFIARTEHDACTALAAELGRLLVDTTGAATRGP